MNELSGKVAIVTGGSAGIGRAAAIALAAEGAAVAVADLDVVRGTEVAKEITDKGGHAVFFHVDVADDDQVAMMVHRTIEA